MAKPIIFIRRFNAGTVNYVYRCRNFDQFNLRFKSPISPMPLPEEDDDNQILVKVEGNSTTLTVNWLIKPQSTNTGSNHNGASAPGTTQSIWEQLLYWENFMVGVGFASSFDVVIGDENTTDLDAPIPTGILYQKSGYVTDFSANTSGQEPNSFRGMFTLIVGNAVTSYNTNAPSEVLNFRAVDGTLSGQVDLTWDDPSDSGSSAITEHIIFYKTGTDQWDLVSAGAAANSATISGLTPGATYQFKIFARNSDGDGRRTGIRESIAKV